MSDLLKQEPSSGMGAGDSDLNVLCRECGLPYKEHGLDITLPNEQWLMIHPQDGGVLCGTCIAKRAGRLPGAIAVRAYIEFADDQTTRWARVNKV